MFGRHGLPVRLDVLFRQPIASPVLHAPEKWGRAIAVGAVDAAFQFDEMLAVVAAVAPRKLTQCAEMAGGEAVKQTPQILNAVFYRGAREANREVDIQCSGRPCINRVRVLDLLHLVENDDSVGHARKSPMIVRQRFVSG